MHNFKLFIYLFIYLIELGDFSMKSKGKRVSVFLLHHSLQFELIDCFWFHTENNLLDENVRRERRNEGRDVF